MGALDQVESKLDEMLVKKAPFQLPEAARKWIADYAWILALIGVILGALTFFPLLTVVGLLSGIGVAVGAGFAVIAAWISLAVLGAYTIVLAIAVPKLKKKQASGWNLVFYSTLFFFAYDVVNWLRAPVAGLFSLVLNVIGTVIGLYFLFQVRSYFKGAKAAAAPVKK